MTPTHNNEVPFYLKMSQILIGLVAFFYVLYIGQEIIIPLIYATIFAILLNPVVNFMINRGMGRVTSIFFTLILAFLLTALLIYFLSIQMAAFSDTFPQLKLRFLQMFQQCTNWASQTFNIRTSKINTWLDQMKEQGLSNSGSMISSTLSTLGGLFSVIFLLPVYIFMILFYKPLLLEFIAQLFPNDKHEAVHEVLTKTKSLIQSYLVGLLLEAAIVATLNSTALLLLGIQYAILLGVIGALLNLIPYIGGIVAIALPMLVALATEEPVYALFVFGAYIFVQLVDNNFIVPKVVASKVKINALISIIVVLIGGALWGVAGMFIAIPLTAILKVIFDKIDSLKPFGFLLGDTMPQIGKSFFQLKKKRKPKATVLLCLCCALTQAQTTADIDAACMKELPKVIDWRRSLHQSPELSNREFKTAAFIEKNLRSLGLEVKTGIAKTGVVGILKGALPGPVIGLRADMDALPVTERTKVPFASHETAEFNGQTVGVMHACGHDSHVAMLLGTAEVLSGMKAKIRGTVVFIFQPAEEGPPAGEEGGAPLMIKEGVMDNPKIDVVFGLHIEARTEIGKIRYRSGAFMASSDWFTIKVKGKSSHGATPWNGIDPVVVGSQIVAGLQTIVSRQEDLSKAPVVITVGKFNGGVRENIIPEEVTLAGTIRTLDSAMQREVHERIRRMAINIAEASGATAEVTIDNKTLVTYNTPELVAKMLPALEKAADPGKLEATNWRTGGEDFSFFGTKAPTFFFNVGGMPKGMKEADAFPHHTPDFYIDDSRLDVGMKAFCELVVTYGALKY